MFCVLIEWFLDMKKSLLPVLTFGLIFYLFILAVSAFAPSLQAYNKHMCAVYGYREDCKTPLSLSERLK